MFELSFGHRGDPHSAMASRAATLSQSRRARPRRPDAAGLCCRPARPKRQAASRDARSVILVWLAGGPSHIDMYDLKPDAPAEFRGEFKPIDTNVPGIQIGEHLPLQAQDHGQAGDRPLGLPHQRRPRHGLAVDADRLPADDRGQRQHLSRRCGSRRRQDEGAERARPARLRQPAAARSASARPRTSARRTTRSRPTATRTTTASRCAT